MISRRKEHTRSTFFFLTGVILILAVHTLKVFKEEISFDFFCSPIFPATLRKSWNPARVSVSALAFVSELLFSLCIHRIVEEFGKNA